MERSKSPPEDKDKRRELLLETSRRRLERTQEKLTLVRKKLLDCREEEKARWTVAERELAESCKSELLRIQKLEGVTAEVAPEKMDSIESSLEASPPSLEIPPPSFEEVVDHSGRVEELEMELETVRMELSVQVKQTAKLQDDLATQAKLLENSRAEVEGLTSNLAQEQAASELLLLEKGELEQTMGEMQLELRSSPNEDLLAALHTSLKEKSDEVEHLQSSLRSEAEVMTRLREELRAAQTLIDDTLERSTHASLREQEWQARLEEALAEKVLDEERSKTRHSKFEQQLEAAQERQARLEEELQVSHAREARLQEELEAARSRLSAAENELEAALARQATLEEELQAAHGLIDETLDGKTQQAQEFQQKLAALEELSQSQAVDLLEKNRQLTELKAAQVQFEEMVANRDSELSLLRPLVQ